MAGEITVSERAYCKIILHAAKYPHLAVNGVLLAEKPKTKESKGLKIIDAIPLFHLTLTLAPMMEIALTQVDAHCKAHGLVVGGYYHANEHHEQNKPNAIAQKLADKIHDNFKEACLIMLENDSLSLECTEEAYKIYTCIDAKWKPIENRSTVEHDTLAKASSLLQSRAYKHLIDFDLHLDDIALDWQNLEINNMIEHST